MSMYLFVYILHCILNVYIARHFQIGILVITTALENKTGTGLVWHKFLDTYLAVIVTE